MNFQELLLEMFRAHGWKASLTLLVTWLAVQLLPIAGFMVVGTVLVISDWITGVTAAHKKGLPITSRGFFRSVQKVVFYCLAIVLVVVVEKTFFKSSIMAYTIAVYIALVELYSNLENISVITGTNVINIVKKTVRTLLSGKDNAVKEITKEIDKSLK